MCRWLLAEVSAGGRQLLCHQVPVSDSCSVIICGALVQTHRQQQLLASKLSWAGTETCPARGPGRLSAVGTGRRRDRCGWLGTGGCSMGRMQGGIAQGTKKGPLSEAINLETHSLAF